MIAMQPVHSEYAPETPPRRREQHADRSRAATRRRLARAQRRGYAAFLRVGAVVALVVVPLLLYVTLTANLTSLNYALARAQSQKAELLAQTMRQDDRIAKLESRERLAAIAQQLHMHDPQTYAVARVPKAAAPPPVAAPSAGVELLGAVGHWLDTAVSGSPR